MSPTIVTESALARNLASLGERNSDLVEQIESAVSCATVSFETTPQGVEAVTLAGRPLCSRHRPLDEADRLTESIDLIEHAVIVVLGFGAGYHVRCLAERMGKAGVIIVFEPDVALLRAVFERIDHSSWLRKSLVVWVTDPDDRGALARKLDGSEAIVAQGVQFLEHPASRARLGERTQSFVEMFSNHVSAAKTTLTTTLMRSVDTVRNHLLNLDHYAAGAGITELENIAAGYPAVVVSAGPSLRKNVHLLAEPGVRDRCVIIAAQTTLKPLLDAGIRPHFVTALDYHEISRRFYDGLDPDAVRDVTLIAEPKANPVILDTFPGPLRCCSTDFLDMLLGDLKRPMGSLPSGSTVAHLAVYVARYLGCDPIALIGQDLGFTDGLYYTPGTAIHEVWAPELNPFNTIEMMEWQRIVRHRLHLKKIHDVNGRSMYTDLQMITYLHQFERDFAQYEQEGLNIIDATEGGAAKQHVKVMPLAEVLSRYATRPLPDLPLPSRDLDASRLETAGARVREVRREIVTLRQTSRNTAALIRKMLADQLDVQKMQQHFGKIERYRKEVEQRFASFEILNQLNQLGVFKRFKADRRLQMQGDMDPLQRQRAQLERDLENVTWIADAAEEIIDQLSRAEAVLKGDSAAASQQPARNLVDLDATTLDAGPSRVAAMVPIDPNHNGLGVPRSLTDQFEGKTVIQHTLERLGKSQRLESIILIVPRGFDIEAAIDPERIDLPIEIERCDGSPFGPEHQAIAAARLWSDTSWRGGIGGMTIYDELLCPQVMSSIMQQRGLTAALIVGPDWPVLDVSAETGCDAVVARHLESPQQHNLVFTQAPPGLCGCLISTSLMRELSERTRLSTVGGLVVYQPQAPQHDPIARNANVQIDHRVSRSRIRATFDSPRCRRRLRAALKLTHADADRSPADLVDAITKQHLSSLDELPQHVILELCCSRTSSGIFSHTMGTTTRREPLSLDLARRIFSQVATEGDCVLTLGGAGDPLLHEDFDRIVRLAKEAGVRGVHLRTELLADRSTLDRLLECGVDVVSVDLHADRAVTYEKMMGVDRFRDVIENLHYLITNRTRLTDHPPNAAFALPWIVPRLQRRSETYEDIETFFDRWQATLGAAVIEGLPSTTTESHDEDPLTQTAPPARVMVDEARRRMTILSDGSVPVSELDYAGDDCVGNVADTPVAELWCEVSSRREQLARDLDDGVQPSWVRLP